jgi:rhodanese-related sulfurtransferase
MSKAEFITALTDGLSEPPKYFFVDAGINKAGYEHIDVVLKKNTEEISVEQFQKEMAAGALIIDTRDADTFEKDFIPSSINIGLGGQYAIWVGSLIDYKTPLVLICEKGKETESVLRLARIGFENVKGILKDGIAAWKNAGLKTDTVDSITADEFAKAQSKAQSIIDVRNEGEWSNTGIIKNAQKITLAKLEDKLSSLDKNQHHYVHCAGGYRSMIAASIMKKHGFNSVTNIRGGVTKIKEAGVELFPI